MKAYELLMINRSLLEAMERCSLGIGDVRHVDMIREYISLSAEGNKKTYIIRVLSDKYNVPERTLYRTIDRLCAEC